MHARTEPTSENRRTPSHPIYVNDGLSPKKTAFIIVTVIGCIAILWPKVFYPMMFGGSPMTDMPKQKNLRDHRPAPIGCCFNATPMLMGPQLYRKQLNLFTGEISLRQERPAHLHPDSVYQAMRERGRAIPATPTIPIIERQGSANKPRFVEGRPGPIPGMRPPMGAGSVHQPQTKGSSMGFIMPLYTIGIIIFFGYTIMKVVFKKQIPNAPYGAPATDSHFRKDVFGQENGRHIDELKDSKLGWREHHTRNYQPQIQDPNLTTNTMQSESNSVTEITVSSNGSKLYNASLSAATIANNLSTSLRQKQQSQMEQLPQQRQAVMQQSWDSEYLAQEKLLKQDKELLEIELLRKKLEQTERAMAKLIAEMNNDQYQTKKSNENSTSNIADISSEHKDNKISTENDAVAVVGEQQENQAKVERQKRGASVDRSVAVLGMEVTASCEGGKKWTGRPPTPVLFSHNEHSNNNFTEDRPEPQSIYLEGALAHESQILVADSETTTENVYNSELNGSAEEPAVVLSSKMTLSLINLDASQEDKTEHNKQDDDIESPLADDIEIISPYEK